MGGRREKWEEGEKWERERKRKEETNEIAIREQRNSNQREQGNERTCNRPYN
jgi:hypothetical protein